MNLVVKQTWTRNLVGAAVLAALAACGGGGGGSANNNTGGGTEQTASVTGVAAKGLMKNAQVRALRASDNVVLAQTTTNDAGQYTLTGLPPGTAVIIEVTPIAGTTMLDEATNTEIPVATGFVLRAATVADAQGTTNVQITPFSEMAYQKAKAAAGSGSLTADTIISANADVRLYVGFDILSERPEFSADGSAAKNKAALMLAAVSKLADDGALGCNALTEQADKVKCVVEAMADLGTDDFGLGEDLDDAKGFIASDPTEFENVDDDPIPQIEPQPETLVPISDRATSIDAAKALIANIRSNGAFIGGQGDTLETRLRTVVEMLNGAANPMGDSSRQLYSAVLQAANALDEGTLVGPDVSFNPEVAQSIGCKLYEGTDPSANNWNTTAEDSATAGSIGCRVTYRIEIDGQGAVTALQHNFRVIRGVVEDGSASYTVKSRLIRQVVEPDGEGGYLVADTTAFTPLAPAQGALTAFYDGDVALGRDEGGYPYSFEMHGEYAGGLNQVLAELSLVNTVDLSLVPTFSPVQDLPNERTIRLGITGSVKASGGSATPVTASILPTSYIESRFDTAGSDSLQATETMASARAGQLLIEAVNAQGAGLTGKLVLSAFGQLDADYVPTSIRLEGAVKSATNTELFSGLITADVESLNGYSRLLPYSVENRVVAPEVHLAGKLTIPNRAPLDISLTVTHSFEEGERLTVVGNYEQGDDTVMLAALLTDDDATSEVTLSTPAGLRLRIQGDVDFAVLDNTSNEVALGRLDLKKSKIVYADGSFEQY